MSKRPWYYQGLAVNICHNSHLMFMSIVVRVKENDSINGSVNTPSCFVPATSAYHGSYRQWLLSEVAPAVQSRGCLVLPCNAHLYSLTPIPS